MFAIAQIAGGDWPQLALEAYNELANGKEVRGQKSEVGRRALEDYHHLTAPVAQASSPAGFVQASLFPHLLQRMLQLHELRLLLGQLFRVLARARIGVAGLLHSDRTGRDSGIAGPHRR